MRGRAVRKIARHHHFGAHVFPGRRRKRIRMRRRLDGDPRRDLDRQAVMGLLEADPGHVVAEKIHALAPLDWNRGNIQRHRVHALAHPVDRRQMQRMMRVSDLRRILVGRGLADVVDHASASQSASDRSVWARCEESMVSESFIKPFSLLKISSASILEASTVHQAGRDRGGNLLRRRQAAVRHVARQRREMLLDTVELIDHRTRIVWIERQDRSPAYAPRSSRNAVDRSFGCRTARAAHRARRRELEGRPSREQSGKSGSRARCGGPTPGNASRRAASCSPAPAPRTRR